MSNDPLPPNPGGAWVTASPSHNRPSDLPADIELHRPTFAVPRGMQWGFASLMLGAPLFVGTPVLILLNRNLWTMGPSGMNMPMAFVAGLLAFLMILGLAGAGISFGIRGWVLAASERQPIALGLAGALLNAVAFFIWAGLGVDLLMFFIHHMR